MMILNRSTRSLLLMGKGKNVPNWLPNIVECLIVSYLTCFDKKTIFVWLFRMSSKVPILFPFCHQSCGYQSVYRFRILTQIKLLDFRSQKSSLFFPSLSIKWMVSLKVTIVSSISFLHPKGMRFWKVTIKISGCTRLYIAIFAASLCSIFSQNIRLFGYLLATCH